MNGIRQAPNAVVFGGQSLLLIGQFPASLMANVTGARVPYANRGVGAMGWDELLAVGNGNVNYLANSGQVTTLVMVGGTSNIGDGQSGATAYGYAKDYADSAHTAGFDHVIMTTLTPASSFTGAKATAFTDLNALIVANADGAFDYVVDIAADPDLDDPANTTYYSDGTHWTIAGGAIGAALVWAGGLSAILGY